jgi:hypothetical protein
VEQDIKKARLIAHLLDTRFEFLGVRFGLNAVLELFPGFGDVVATGLSLYIIYMGKKLNVPSSVLTRMFANVMVASVVGLIPWIGDAFYIFYKPNTKNAELLTKYISASHIPTEIPDLPLSK